MIRVTQGTQHCITANYGVAIPAASVRTPNMVFTCPKGNAGTIYIAFHATAPQNWAVARREQTLIPLTSGESVTFRSVARAGHAPEDMLFGPGYSYLLCDAAATTRRAVFTYYKFE